MHKCYHYSRIIDISAISNLTVKLVWKDCSSGKKVKHALNLMQYRLEPLHSCLNAARWFRAASLLALSCTVHVYMCVYW